mgnify:CR=1 FL=1
MFVVLLKFSAQRERARVHMEGHVQWLQRGFDDGVFLLSGTLQPQAGGALLAHGISREQLQARLDEDPFVREEVVSAEIVEITPSRTDPRLAFLG